MIDTDRHLMLPVRYGTIGIIQVNFSDKKNVRYRKEDKDTGKGGHLYINAQLFSDRQCNFIDACIPPVSVHCRIYGVCVDLYTNIRIFSKHARIKLTDYDCL